MTHLNVLMLSGTQVTDAGLVHLKGLNELGVLQLDRTQITDAGLTNLEGLSELSGLNLSQTLVTDEGMVHLKAMPSLNSLFLNNTRVGDAGVQSLATMQLYEVFLEDTLITPACAKDLSYITPYSTNPNAPWWVGLPGAVWLRPEPAETYLYEGGVEAARFWPDEAELQHAICGISI